MGQALRGIDASFVDTLVVPASLHDVAGWFVHMKRAAERALGTANSEMVGRHFTAPLHPDARTNVEAQFRRAADYGEPTDFETAFVDATGRLRGVRAQHLPLKVDGEIVGVLILAFDVRTPPSKVVDHAAVPVLTPRQREVLDLIASGLTTSEIARELALSVVTVRNYLQSLLSVLDVHTRLEALAMAQRVGLLAAPVLGPPRPELGLPAG
jgi:PAS domain S-box-containing protein